MNILNLSSASQQFIAALQIAAGDNIEAISLISYFLENVREVTDYGHATQAAVQIEGQQNVVLLWPATALDFKLIQYLDRNDPVQYDIHRHTIMFRIEADCRCQPLLLGLYGLIAIHQAKAGNWLHKTSTARKEEDTVRWTAAMKFIWNLVVEILDIQLFANWDSRESDDFISKLTQAMHKKAPALSEYDRLARYNLFLVLWVTAPKTTEIVRS